MITENGKNKVNFNPRSFVLEEIHITQFPFQATTSNTIENQQIAFINLC